MKELKKKTFLTIFAILTCVLLFSLILVNVQNYNREWELIHRNLNVYDDKGNFRGADDWEKLPKDLDRFGPEQIMFIDREVYTIELTNGAVKNIITHGNTSEDFDIQSVTETILKTVTPGTESIGNLFFAPYAYHYGLNDRIVVVNNSDANAGCRELLLISVLIFAIAEAVIAFLSGLVTGWITKPARESFRKQKEFIADASHELKTPLAVIMASADELARADELPEAKERPGMPETTAGASQKLLNNIRYESDRMNKLIAQLLTLSKLEEGAEVPYAEEDISKLAEKTALAYEAVAFEQGVGIETEIAKHVRFTCNKDEMEKMFSILLDNAVKHSYRDTSVRVELNECKEQIRIRIINRGDPIPAGDEEKIFERFYRGDASRSRTENRYGLGLAIAKSIVTGHHGSIKAGSDGGSTVFEISLKKK